MGGEFKPFHFFFKIKKLSESIMDVIVMQRSPHANKALFTPPLFVPTFYFFYCLPFFPFSMIEILSGMSLVSVTCWAAQLGTLTVR